MLHAGGEVHMNTVSFHLLKILVTRIIIPYSFFYKLKSNPRYLNHHVNRRCDDLIEILLAVETDTFFERKRKELRTK